MVEESVEARLSESKVAPRDLCGIDEEEDTCHMRRRIHVNGRESTVAPRDLLSAPVEIRKSQYRSMFTI